MCSVVTAWTCADSPLMEVHEGYGKRVPVLAERGDWQLPQIKHPECCRVSVSRAHQTASDSSSCMYPKTTTTTAGGRILNSSGQIAIAFVCALVLVLTHQQHLTLLCLAMFTSFTSVYCTRVWRIQEVPLLKRPRFLANRTCTEHKSLWGYADTRLHDQKFVLEKGYPSYNIPVFKIRDMSIFGFLPVFTWPFATGLLLISRF